MATTCVETCPAMEADDAYGCAFAVSAHFESTGAAMSNSRQSSAHKRHHKRQHGHAHHPKRHAKVTEYLGFKNKHDLHSYQTAMNAEPEITNRMKAIASEQGAQLLGLAFRTKKPESTQEKLYGRPGEDIEIDSMYDLVRYTMELSPKVYAKKYDSIRQDLEDSGYHVKNVWNAWTDDTNPYNGVNIKLSRKDGVKLELQLHTTQSFQAKQEMHSVYEASRVLPEDDPRQRKLRKEMFEISDRTKVPKDIDSIKRKDEQ